MEIASFIPDFEYLPKKIQKQVFDYVEFLLVKYKKENSNDSKDKKFKFDWENELSGLKDDYTSVELQHKANDLR